MKKNLKKAISAVMALAVAASLVPATFAAKLTLTDVADTASYATAVNTLVALDVINGYEDGTFLPDNLITRAEVTKVIVAALNQTAAAEGMTGSTGFSDVADDFWANGFINAGTQIGFINGMGDGTFAPQENVTYAQVVKMLVSSLGYEDYAQYMGGWPNGYLSIAASEGVTDGVKANANDAVTRAQVAQLVYNALNTPIVENTGMEYSSAGILVPTIAKQDGKGDDTFYKTLLTENFDAYLVEGFVTDTHKGGSLDVDQVTFGVAKSKKYDHDELGEITTTNDITKTYAITPVYVGDTDAAAYQNVYATAIIMVDEYDDYVMISFTPSGKNKTVTFTSDLLDTSDYEDSDDNFIDDAFKNATDNFLMIFASETAKNSTKYQLQKTDAGVLDVDLFVNGFEIKDATREQIEEYVLKNEIGTLELVDTYKTDGYYDTIYVEHYATAEVTSITASSGKVSLDQDKGTVPAGSITLDDEDDDLVYHIYLDGEEITVADIQEGDILSIAYDVTAANTDKAAFQTSEFYEIYVSRATASGKVTSRDADEGWVVIGGETYKFVGSYADLNMASEYAVTLDYFGRIYDYEIESSSVKYAVIDKFIYSTSDEAYKATLYTSDGVAKVYVFDGKVVADDANETVLANDAAAEQMIYDTVYTGTVAGKAVKADVENRVIEYKVSSSTGELTQVKFLTADAQSDPADEYQEKNTRIGSVKMSAATKLIDAIEYVDNGYDSYNDIRIAADLSALVDGTAYGAFAYGEKYSDGTYPLVLLVSGEGAYNATTRFAVVADAASEGISDTEDEIYTLPVLYNGEETTLTVAEDAEGDSVTSLKKGDVIFFLNGSEGYVDQIDVIFSFNGAPTYSQLLATLVKDNDEKIIDNGYVTYPVDKNGDLYDDFEEEWVTTGDEPIQLVFGPIVNKGASDFAIGSITSVTDLDIGGGKTYTGNVTYRNQEIKKAEGGYYEIDTTDKTNVYTWDYAQTKNYTLSTGAILATSFSTSFNANDGDIVLWDAKDPDDGSYVNQTAVNFAFAMVVDGEATDVFVFLAE